MTQPTGFMVSKGRVALMLFLIVLSLSFGGHWFCDETGHRKI